MRKSRFTEAQIVAALRQAEGGVAVAELCRKLEARRRRFTAGSASPAGWASASCENSASSATRIGS